MGIYESGKQKLIWSQLNIFCIRVAFVTKEELEILILEMCKFIEKCNHTIRDAQQGVRDDFKL